MRIIIIILLLFALVNAQVYCQDLPKEFLNNQCEYFINKSDNKEGIKMKIHVPCAWDTALESRPFIIKTFSYSLDTANLAVGVVISKSPVNITQKDRDNLFKKEWASNVFKSVGELLSVKKVQMDAKPWAEYVFQSTIDAPQGKIYQYVVLYYVFYKNVSIAVMYKVISNDIFTAAYVYVDYLNMFRTLASGISVYNFWE